MGGITFVRGVRVSGMDADARVLTLSDGRTVKYGKVQSPACSQRQYYWHSSRPQYVPDSTQSVCVVCEQPMTCLGRWNSHSQPCTTPTSTNHISSHCPSTCHYPPRPRSCCTPTPPAFPHHAHPHSEFHPCPLPYYRS
jgi:hypothetical protein